MSVSCESTADIGNTGAETSSNEAIRHPTRALALLLVCSPSTSVPSHSTYVVNRPPSEIRHARSYGRQWCISMRLGCMISKLEPTEIITKSANCIYVHLVDTTYRRNPCSTPCSPQSTLLTASNIFRALHLNLQIHLLFAQIFRGGSMNFSS